MTSNYQYASPRYGRRYPRNLGYLGYGGVVSGVLRVPRVPRGRVRKPGRWVSGVPRVLGQEGR